MRRYLLLAMLLVGCEGAAAKPDPAATTSVKAETPARATRVEVAVLELSDAPLSLMLPGEVEASRDAHLAAALGGYVEKVNVEPGAKVKKGQVLALIDTATHSARRAQATVEIKTAERELERAKQLGGALPRAQLEAAESRLDAARAAYRSADVMVARSVISAPFAGVAASVDLEVGEVAPPGAPLIRIVQTDPIVVSVSLSDRDLASIEVGMTASVSADAIGGVRSGKVAHIRPAADLNTRSFTAEVSVDNADGRLMPGMIASVRLERAAGSKQMVLAQDWLVTKPNQLGVFIHDEGVARWRAVETGQVVGDRVIVASGLSGGDELVVTGHRELVDGDPLIVARRGTCCREGRVFYDEEKR